MSSNRRTVVLWAVDPFSGEWKAQRSAAKAIAALTAKRPCVIQPVYVAANPLPNLPQGYSIEVFEGVREKGQDRFDQMVEGITIGPLAPLKVIQVKNLSTTEQITELLSYAKEIGAELIVTATRARKGVPRWFFGSFSESLSLRSPVPLLIVNPSWKPSPAQGKRPLEPFKRILFPTDFSEASHEAFHEIIRFAKANGSRIELFHKFYHVAEPVWNSPLEAKLSYQAILDQGLNEVKETAQKWIAEARAEDVPATSKIDSGPEDTTADAILNHARGEDCLIAMAAQSSKLEVRLLGSVTRKLIRTASNPVWVLHPSSKAGETRKVS